MNNPSAIQKMIEEKMPEVMERYKSTLVENIQSTEQKIDYQTYHKNLFSEKNT